MFTYEDDTQYSSFLHSFFSMFLLYVLPLVYLNVE